jgi:hypothetical protein
VPSQGIWGKGKEEWAPGNNYILSAHKCICQERALEQGCLG